MARSMLNNQRKKQRACHCGRNTIYTGDNAKYNKKIDGVEVCNDCYVDSIKKRFGL